MKKVTDTGMTLLIISALAYLMYSDPRPTVHRIQAGNFLGSGVSVATYDGQTLVLTANHVIKDGGPYTVAGYPAKIIGRDKTWDLAALVIDETLPTAQLGNREPQIGDELTVCGYGYGKYAEATGKVVGFFAPATPDWVAIDASARSGDSGGPLFYDDGTVAAILFGSDKTGAHGTHCLRVRAFLNKIKGYDNLLKALDNTYNIW
jgi:S1-C subfamily serine protease